MKHRAVSPFQSSFKQIIFIALVTLTTILNAKALIPLLSDLSVDAKHQQKTNRVIMLYVSAPHCAFCKKLEKEIFDPLLYSGEYDDRIILRKVDWHSSSMIKNFDGIKQLPQDFLKAYEIKITPTLLFLDSTGRQILKPLLGYRGGEFYWFYFDAAINKANNRLKTLDYPL